MMRVVELTGAHLDYWVARAEGIPAEQLTIRRVQRSTDTHCVRAYQNYGPLALALMYSTSWGQGGPLIEKHGLALGLSDRWYAGDVRMEEFYTGDATGEGDTPLQAICRAVVRAAFGDEVGEVAVHG